jgi:hypothetical protein
VRIVWSRFAAPGRAAVGAGGEAERTLLGGLALAALSLASGCFLALTALGRRRLNEEAL